MYEHPGDGALDYFPCRYGKSKLLVRGPKRKLDGDYCTMLGGTETYGKFIEKPFPALLEARTCVKVVNLGCVNAGVDVFASDPALLDICRGGRVTVVQVLGAQNMSNRFYAVHPRRNDRFLRASTLMKTLFREVDFTDFAFTRHMLTAIRDASPEKFAMVRQELQAAWLGRMRLLAGQIGGKSVLLHLSAPPRAGDIGLGADPLFIDDAMIDQLRDHYSAYLRVDAGAEALSKGTDGMVFSEMERPAASEIPGPAVHREIAAALAPVIERLI